MAQVMNEMSGSNGELKEDNEEIKINGDACLISAEQEHSHTDELSNETCINKKILTDVNNVDKFHELTEKNINTIANGHFKSDQTDGVTYRDENKIICDNKNDLLSHRSQFNEPMVAAVTSSLTIRKVSDNADCDNISISSVQQNDEGSTDENEVLNLKTNNVSNKIINSPNIIHKRSEDALSMFTECCSDEKTECRLGDSSVKSETESCDNESSIDDSRDDDVISVGSTPDKFLKKNKKPMPALTVTPRRSSRNLNKQQKSYVEKESEYEEDTSSAANTTTITPVQKKKANDDDEIEEVTPTDPLADDPKLKIRNKTIVVSDTKGLVEFASSAKASRSNKKEPTLVIIDTNSILSGKGPIPVSQSSNTLVSHSSSNSAPIPVSLPIPAGALVNAARGVPPSTSAFSVIPIGLPAQGMYSQYKTPPPPQIKPIVVGPASTTVTPITVPPANVPVTNMQPSTTSSISSSVKQPPVILPSLTDDMFVVEAPSFIVPYVYEKPPMRSLKDHIEKLEIEIKELEEKERIEKEEKEREEKEKAEKLKQEKELAEAEEKLKDAEREKIEDGKILDKDDESEEKIKEDINKLDDTAEKESGLQMEVEEEGDPNAAKVTCDTDIILGSSKKLAEPEKKEILPSKEEKKVDESKKPVSYFDNPLGKFFMQIGLNLVQEHVQTDLLRSQKRKRDKEGDKCSPDVKIAIETLTKTLESSKENNDPFKLELKKCELCSFKTESLLVMAHHLETPHMKNYTYRCNFCPLEVRSPHDILFHMEAEHNIRGRLERAPAFHQCPNCPFEDNQKGKLTRHLVSCSKKYRAERNQEPPLDWEPPAKIPRVTRNRPPSMSPGNAVYQAAMSGLKQVPQNSLLPKLLPNATNMKHGMMNVNKRPNVVNQNFVNRYPTSTTQSNFPQRPISVQNANQGLMYRGTGSNAQTQVLLPPSYQLSGAQIYQQNQNIKQSQQQQQGSVTAKIMNQPSISITPLPRQTSTMPSTSGSATNVSTSNIKPGKPMTNLSGKSSFVVCEICDGYIKDLEQLRNHMQWIHKVKIHPKMIYNRPPLNCQKCQFRFFTDQGLERHLLGSHGLVTSSMQEAANKGKDSGRCPVCGRVYQWKLLNHVARDHQMALKPAHLSYKCTVCTATFGMYKQFESHVYSAHSVVAKRAMDTKKPPMVSAPSSSSQNDTLLKPLKINDEITIIPQPVRSVKPNNNKIGSSTNTSPIISNKGKDFEDDDKKEQEDEIESDDDDGGDDDNNICNSTCAVENFSDQQEYKRHIWERHVRPCSVKITRLNSDLLKSILDRENGFEFSSKRSTLNISDLRRTYNLKDFSIQLTNLKSLRSDYLYKVIYHDDIHPEFLVPDTILFEFSDEKIPQLPKSVKPLFSVEQPPEQHASQSSTQQTQQSSTLQTPQSSVQVVTKINNDTVTSEPFKESLSPTINAVVSFLKEPHFMIKPKKLPPQHEVILSTYFQRQLRPTFSKQCPNNTKPLPVMPYYFKSSLESLKRPSQQPPSSVVMVRRQLYMQKALRSIHTGTNPNKYNLAKSATATTTTTTSFRYRSPSSNLFMSQPRYAMSKSTSSSLTTTRMFRPLFTTNSIVRQPGLERNVYFSNLPKQRPAFTPPLRPLKISRPVSSKQMDVIDLLSDSDNDSSNDNENDDVQIVEPENNLNVCNEYILSP